MLKWNRTSFDKGARKVFHVVPKASTAYTDLCLKYGGEYVLRGNGATDGTVLAAAIARCTTGGDDIIRLYPGTFVAGAVVTIDKTVTIEGASDNPGAVLWDCDTTDCAAFSITADGVTLRNFSVDEAAAGTTSLITSSATGTTIDNLVVRGGNIASASATIALSGTYSSVTNCKLYLVRKGIRLLGSYSVAKGNIITGTDGTAGNFGVQGDGAAAVTAQIIDGNLIFMTGAANPDGIAIEASSDLAVVVNNTVMAADPFDYEADTYGVNNLALTATWVTVPVWTTA